MANPFVDRRLALDSSDPSDPLCLYVVVVGCHLGKDYYLAHRLAFRHSDSEHIPSLNIENCHTVLGLVLLETVPGTHRTLKADLDLACWYPTMMVELVETAQGEVWSKVKDRRVSNWLGENRP